MALELSTSVVYAELKQPAPRARITQHTIDLLGAGMPSRDELHDLLTPLAVMKGAISIVLKHGDRLDPEVRDRWLQLAIEQSDQLNVVMNELRASEAEAQAAAEAEALAEATDRGSIRVEVSSSGSRELVE